MDKKKGKLKKFVIWHTILHRSMGILLVTTLLFNALPVSWTTALGSENVDMLCKQHKEHTISEKDNTSCEYKCYLCSIEELIAALPDEVTEDNMEKVRTQLDKILALYGKLTEEEQEQTDLTRCLELQEALDAASVPVTADVAAGDVVINSGSGQIITFTADQCGSSCQGHTITQNVSVAQNTTILVESGIHNITFSGLNLTTAKVGVMPGGTMNLTIAGTNSISAVSQSAGIYVPVGATLVITEQRTGSLDVSGSGSGSGIGGGVCAPNDTGGYTGNLSCGTVIINGGTIIANGGNMSAGIGGANGNENNPIAGNGGTVTINGGTVTATGSGDVGYYGGAGIGGGIYNGKSGNGGTLTINGGHVTLSVGTYSDEWGVAYGFGRGNGSNDNAGTLTLSDESYLTLADSTTLDPNGTYRITINPTVDMIIVPTDMHYISADMAAEIEKEVTISGKEICGQIFEIDMEGWSLSVTKKSDLEYTAVYTHAEKGSVSKPVIILPCLHGDGAALTHNEKVEADCTHTGILEYWDCSVCGKKFSDQDGQTEITDTEIPIAAHTLTYHEKVEADCTQVGNIEYWDCSVCGKKFSDQDGQTEISDIEIPIIAHTLIYHARVEASCLTEGNIEYWNCNVCDKLFSDKDGTKEVTNIKIPAVGHNYSDWQSNGNGTHTRNCQTLGCGFTETEDCSGGTASYTDKAVCEICKHEYGEVLEDSGAPTGEISISTSKWNSFLNTITFGLFFKNAEEVMITAEDQESGVKSISYYISGSGLSEEEVSVLDAEWTVVNAATTTFSISREGSSIVYAKIVDHQENVTYISSDGLILDETPPSITGVVEGETYCTPQTVTVTDDYLESVTVNGKAEVLSDNKFTLGSASNAQIIEARDKAGNISTVTVIVNAEHNYEANWKSNADSHWHECTCGNKSDIAAHIENDGIVTKPATKTEKGIKTYQCRICGYVMRTEEIDMEALTGTIEISGNKWSSFLSAVTFGLYKNTQEVISITSNDNEDIVKIYYLIATEKTTYSLKELEANENWTLYNDFAKPTLKKNTENVVYAKLENTVGNVTYISTNGIIEDEVPPVASLIVEKVIEDSITLQVSSSEDGTYYLVISTSEYTDIESIKNAENVLTGKLTADTMIPIFKGELSKNTNYNVYLVVEDYAHNFSEVVKQVVTTKNKPMNITASITGTPEYGEILTASAKYEEKEDLHFSYQWYRSNSVNVEQAILEPIENATNSTYLVQKNDVNKYLVVKATLDMEEYSSSAFSSSIEIQPRTVKINASAKDKIYDKTTKADIIISLTGILAGDNITAKADNAVFEDANAGEGKQVSITGITLDGNDAAYYQLSSAKATATATIKKAPIAPNAPSNSDAWSVANSIETVGNVKGLPEGWSWSNDDLNTSLPIGEEVIANAIYIGEDASNYEIVLVKIKLKRSSCNHDNTEIRNAVAATCTEAGYTGDTYCLTCKEKVQTGSEIEPLGHDYGEGVVTKEPTCTETGEMTYTCSRCNKDSYTKAIDPLGHTEVEIPAVVPTCTKIGLTAGVKCISCNKVLVEQTPIAMIPHDYGEGVVTKKPTVEEEGILTFTCSVCGDSRTEPIAKLPTPEHVHEYTPIIITAATCTQAGIQVSTCSCGDSREEAIPALGHTEEVDSAVAATCEAEGKTEGSHCSVCNEILVEQVIIAALGHDYKSSVTKEPTVDKEGIRTFVCSVCGNSYTEPIEKLPTPEHKHDYKSEITKQPTYNETGVRAFTCSICGNSYTEEIPRLIPIQTPSTGTSNPSNGSAINPGTSTPVTPPENTTETQTPSVTEPDKSESDSTIETKPDGTKVETVTESKPDGTIKETITETQPNGTVKEVVTETKTDGSTTEIKEVVTADNSATLSTVVETNASGSSTINSVIKTGVSDNSNTVSISESLLQEIAQDDRINSVVIEITDTTVKSAASERKQTVVTVEIPVIEGINVEKVLLTKEGIDTAKETGKGLRVNVVSSTKDSTLDNYSVVIPAKQLARIDSSIKEINVTINAACVTSIAESAVKNIVTKVLNKNKGKKNKTCVVSLASNEGVITSMKVTIPVTKKTTITKGSKVYVYKYDAKTGKLVETANYKKTVAQDGSVVIAVASGTDYVISAKKLSGNKVQTIKDSISVSVSKKTARVGKTIRVKVSLPDTISTKAEFGTEKAMITYKSSDSKIASVSKSGIITTKKKGTVVVTVTVKLASGQKITKKQKITVK